MPFTYPATEIFDRDGKRRVVWSQQEFDQALAEGYTEDQPKAEEPAPEPPAPEPPAKTAKK